MDTQSRNLFSGTREGATEPNRLGPGSSVPVWKGDENWNCRGQRDASLLSFNHFISDIYVGVQERRLLPGI